MPLSDTVPYDKGVNKENLIIIKPQQKLNKSVDFGLLNTRSVRNKTAQIKDFVVDKDLDILTVTGTWLKPDN